LHLDFNDGAGSVASDSSGYGNDGNLYNGASWAPGVEGSGVYLSGAPDYIEIPHHSSLDITDAITLTAWVNLTAFPFQENMILVKDYDTCNYPDSVYSLLFDSFDLSPHFSLTEEWIITYIQSSAVSVNSWAHVAGTWNTTHMIVYLNGEPKNSAAFDGPIIVSNQPVRIGSRGPVCGGGYLTGVVDEVKIYSYPLSDDEVLAEYNANKPT